VGEQGYAEVEAGTGEDARCAGDLLGSRGDVGVWVIVCACACAVDGCRSDMGGGRGCRNDTRMVGVLSVLVSCPLMSPAAGDSALLACALPPW
jgi:hypothetical protein